MHNHKNNDRIGTDSLTAGITKIVQSGKCKQGCDVISPLYSLIYFYQLNPRLNSPPPNESLPSALVLSPNSLFAAEIIQLIN
jgi:hypothetical protein